MKEVVAIIVFCFVLFIYLHVCFHLKKVDDLEIYEVCQPSKEKMEEICDLRQPVVTDFANDKIMNNCNFNNLKTNYGGFDIKIRNIKEYDDETELYVPLAINECAELFKKDKDSKYISERNNDFLEESGLISYYQNNDMFLRPSMVSSCMYDIIFASLNAESPLRYDINYRNYMLVTHGKAIIRLLPPKSTKYLYPLNDYENFEFISPVNVWNVQDKYRNDYDKVRSVDVTLLPGQMIYIPAYWWYSIKFVKTNTSICAFKYNTYMSALSISNHIVMKLLQRQNTKRVIAKKLDIKMEKGEGIKDDNNAVCENVNNVGDTTNTVNKLEDTNTNTNTNR